MEVRAQLSTDDHLADPGFWPTRATPDLDEFTGDRVCAKCHQQKFASQRLTPMARTAATAEGSIVLQTHPRLTFQNGPYSFEIKRQGKQSILTGHDGKNSISVVLEWAFGIDQVGQSYLFQREGRWYEARETYFRSLDTLEFTPRQALLNPKNLEEAMARPLGAREMMRCFACHATGVPTLETVDTSRITLGIKCEACHGPGKTHATLMEMEGSAVSTGNEKSHSHILNPARLAPADAVDFCGSCHATWWDVRLTGVKGVPSVRSPGYRLQNSKCWGKGDERMTCGACHDPHEQLVRNAEAYDEKCLACHLRKATDKKSADHPGAACPVAQKACTSCHMPKVEITDMHYEFTDHQIRIVRPGQPFPN